MNVFYFSYNAPGTGRVGCYGATGQERMNKRATGQERMNKPATVVSVCAIGWKAA